MAKSSSELQNYVPSVLLLRLLVRQQPFQVFQITCLDASISADACIRDIYNNAKQRIFSCNISVRVCVCFRVYIYVSIAPIEKNVIEV